MTETTAKALPAMRYLSLFSGFGGLDMAVEQLWPDAVCVAHCENNKAASTVLAARWPDVPNLQDVTTVDWSDLGDVDLIVGGFPCQDISHAGKQAGITEETRSGLWFHFRDAIRTLRPRLVLVENVAAIATAGGGLDVVLGSLAEIGFDAEWGMLRASDVGAPHRRERWFAIAWPADTDAGGLWPRERPVRTGQPDSQGSRPDAADADLAGPQGGSEGPRGPWTDDGDAGRGGRGDASSADRLTLPTPTAALAGGVQELERRTVPERGDASMLPTPRAASDRTSRSSLTPDGHWSAPSLAQAVELAQGVLPREYESWDEVQGWHGKTLPTPCTTDANGARNATSERSNPDSAHHGGWTLNDVRHADRWGGYAPAIARWEAVLGRCAPDPTDDRGRLSPDFVEWMMGWPDGWSDIDGLSRADRLRGGNGVVTLQAVAAYPQLIDRVPTRT